MKETAIIILLGIVIWMLLGSPMPNTQPEYNFTYGTATVIYLTPVPQNTQPLVVTVPPETIVETRVVTETVIETIALPTAAPSSTPEYNPLTVQPYGISPTGPLSAAQVEACRTLFNNHLENTMTLEVMQNCKYHLGLP